MGFSPTRTHLREFGGAICLFKVYSRVWEAQQGKDLFQVNSDEKTPSKHLLVGQYMPAKV